MLTGIAVAIATPLVLFVAARFLPTARGAWPGELAIALLAAVCAELTATAADFGGLREIDPRAVLFVALVTAGAIGLLRAILVSQHTNR